MLARLILPQSVWEKICQQAVAEWPRECLGMLVGTPDGRVQDAYPIANASTDPHRFLSEPASLLAAEKRRRREGWHLLGFYHSHPDGQPVPSAIDTDPNVNFWLDGTVVSLIIAVSPVSKPVGAQGTLANNPNVPHSSVSEIAERIPIRKDSPPPSDQVVTNPGGTKRAPLEIPPESMRDRVDWAISELFGGFCLEGRVYRLYPGQWELICVLLEA